MGGDWRGQEGTAAACGPHGPELPCWRWGLDPGLPRDWDRSPCLCPQWLMRACAVVLTRGGQCRQPQSEVGAGGPSPGAGFKAQSHTCTHRTPRVGQCVQSCRPHARTGRLLGSGGLRGDGEGRRGEAPPAGTAGPGPAAGHPEHLSPPRQLPPLFPRTLTFHRRSDAFPGPRPAVGGDELRPGCCPAPSLPRLPLPSFQALLKGFSLGPPRPPGSVRAGPVWSPPLQDRGTGGRLGDLPRAAQLGGGSRDGSRSSGS